MNKAEISAGGQVTIPVEILKKLRLKEGDMLLFTERDGEILISNAAAAPPARTDPAGAQAPVDRGATHGEAVRSLLDELRYGMGGKPQKL